MTSFIEEATQWISQARNWESFACGWTALLLSILIAILVYKPQISILRSYASTTALKQTESSPMSSPKLAPLPGQIKVSKILVHPIKSCRGISVQTANYTPEGLENDRIFCIIDAGKVNVITAREVPKMVLITTSIESDGTLRVSFPESEDCPEFFVPLSPTKETLEDWTILPKITLWPTHDPVDGHICESITGPKGMASASLSKYFGKPVHLVYKGPQPRAIDPTTSFPELKATAKYQDMYPLLVLSEESTVAVENELRGRVGTQGIEERWRTDRVPIERFRPNIVFTGGGPFAEDNWEEITIGSEESPVLTLVSKCTRCLLPNVSPETGERDKAVPYKVLMKFRTGLDPVEKMKPCVGCNAVPSSNGTISVGDLVYIKKMV